MAKVVYKLVMMARASSSRGSRNVMRDPGAIDNLSTASRDTSSVMGIGKRTPSVNRRVSTTLLGGLTSWVKKIFSQVPSVIFFVHEALEGAKPAIDNQFKIAKLALVVVLDDGTRGRARLTSVRIISASVCDSSLSSAEIFASRATRSWG